MTVEKKPLMVDGRQLTENERRNIRLNKEKVALLKGQAGHVLDLPLR